MRFLLVLSLLLAVGAAGAQGPAPRDVDAAPPLRAPVLPEPSTRRTADPADSLYKLARAALNDNDYRRAATLFAMVADRYPDSEFAPDALYGYYAHHSRYWGLSVRDDQAAAGLTMALEQSLLMGAALAALFIRALAESERREQRAERFV